MHTFGAIRIKLTQYCLTCKQALFRDRWDGTELTITSFIQGYMYSLNNPSTKRFLVTTISGVTFHFTYLSSVLLELIAVRVASLYCFQVRTLYINM